MSQSSNSSATESSHAPLAPSAFGRWGKCPGSVKANQHIPDTTSPAAQWGTDAHQILEDMLENQFNSKEIPVYTFDDVEEKQAVAQVAFDYAISLFVTADVEGLNPKIFIEEKVYTELYTKRTDIYGSADTIIVTDAWCEIIDLKAGSGILVMPDSGQLRIYALGMLAKIKGEGRSDVEMAAIREVRATIVQPRIPHPDGVIRTEVHTIPKLLAWNKTVLIPAAKATDGDATNRIAGETQCQFCGVKGQCQALQSKATEFAMSVFEDQSGKVPANKKLDDLVSAKPEDLDLDKLAEIIEAAPLITGWLKAVEKYASDRLKNREEVPGYKLVRSGGRNSWVKDTDVILEEISKGANRIPKKLLTKEVVITAPQALKLPDLSDKQRARMQALIGKSEGSLSLVPVTDKRDDAFPPVVFNDISFLD